MDFGRVNQSRAQCLTRGCHGRLLDRVWQAREVYLRLDDNGRRAFKEWAEFNAAKGHLIGLGLPSLEEQSDNSLAEFCSTLVKAISAWNEGKPFILSRLEFD